MHSKLFNVIICFLSLFLASYTLEAQVSEPQNVSPEWSKSYKPFRIAGNLYYVGTYDLSCYLITTPAGNILINTGLASSASAIKKNIQSLGFRFSDTKILLTTQAHYDHMGAMAAIKKSTGATLMLNEKDSGCASDGGRSDYALGGPISSFQPVTADRLLKDGDTISLGGFHIIILHHPGHTKGSSSYLLTVTDETRSYRVLIANLPTIVTTQSFHNMISYPEVAKDYEYTLFNLKHLQFDLWLSSHAGQFNLHSKRKPGDAYNPDAFIDRTGYDAALNNLQHAFNQKMESK